MCTTPKVPFDDDGSVEETNMLHHAACTNNALALQESLEKNADSNESTNPNIRDTNGQTALYFAVDGTISPFWETF